MPFRPFRPIAMLFIAFGLIAATLPARAETPKQLIEHLNDTLLSTMKAAKSLGYKGRYEKLEPVLESTYDMDFMARYSAGRHWRKLTSEQQRDLVSAFSRLTVATYASRFDGYSGESFRIVDEKTPRKGNRLVETELVKSDGEAIRLNYLLRETKEGWRVIDVFLKGTISELATKRSEYSSTLANQGFNGLMSIFKRKIAGLDATKT
jgi:phospholipid transport system substrate-binding protein